MAARRDREQAYRQWSHPLAHMVHDEVGQALLVTLVVVAGLWGFVGLADKVLEAAPRPSITGSSRRSGPRRTRCGRPGPAGWWRSAAMSPPWAAPWWSHF